MTTFQKATKEQSKLRLALIGVSGAGKTYTALTLAQHIGDKVAVVDTEHGSASKYADLFDFDTLELESFHPARYIEAIKAAEDEGYDVLVIDSLSHAWAGKDGALQLVDKEAAKSRSNNKFTAWGKVTPLHIDLIDAMLGAKLHLIGTMRSKTAYVLEADEKGKQVPRKVGMEPVQREGLEFEFDLVGDIDLDNVLRITKTRCPALHGGIFEKPGKEVATALVEWLDTGVKPKPKAESKPEPKDDPFDDDRALLNKVKDRAIERAAEVDVSMDALAKRAADLFDGKSLDDLGVDEWTEIVVRLEKLQKKTEEAKADEEKQDTPPDAA